MTLETYNGWYLSSNGDKLHQPDPDSSILAYSICGVRLSPYRTDDHKREKCSHEKCKRCIEEAP